MFIKTIEFPEYSGLRCLMMPYIQGDPTSVPDTYQSYAKIIKTAFFKKGDIGYLTIDESVALKNTPHRGSRAKTNRALHTEAGRSPNKLYTWGGGWGGSYINGWGNKQIISGWGQPVNTWGGSYTVTLDHDVEVLLANNIDDSCALWNAVHENTSIDGDIGYAASQYPYKDAIMMKAGELHRIGIFTPHESLSLKETVQRQFLRVVSSGVHGREKYFTVNPLVNV